uniref:Polycystin cation channel PKD1/PKD2 domain-containing protein n=1 Tax=Heterosigma akashiwo TaxID=2829 RepID=A0A7S4DKY7_HETAK
MHRSAVKLQKAFRGYKTRRQVMYVQVKELQRMLKDLDRKQRGFSSCFHMVTFLVVYFIVIALQRDLFFAESVQAGLIPLFDGYEEVETVDEAFGYIHTLAYNLYDGNQEESTCNTCTAFKYSFGQEIFDTCEYYCADRMDSADCAFCSSYFLGCFGNSSCDSFEPTLNSSVSKPELSSSFNSSICKDNFSNKVGLTATVAGTIIGQNVSISGRGWLGSNRIFGFPLLTFNLYEDEEVCYDPFNAGIGEFYGKCKKKTTRRSTIWLNETWTDPEYFSLIPPSWLGVVYDSRIGAYTNILELGLMNAGLFYTQCVISMFEETQLFETGTQSLGVIIPTYNGQDTGIFTLTEITFEFTKGGKGNSKLSLQSFPVRNMYSTTRDYIRLALEIYLLVNICYNLILLKHDQWRRFKRVRTLAKSYVCPEAAKQVTKKDPNQEHFIWALIKIILQLSNTMQIINWVWLNFYSISASYLRLPASMDVDGFSTVSIITDTVTNSFHDLVHFLVIFLFIHFLFSSIMWIMVGSMLQNYSCLQSSFETLLLATFGSFNFSELSDVSWLAPVVFFLFEFLVTLLLFNILLSIVLSGYEAAKECAKNLEEPFLESTYDYIGRMILLAKSHCQLKWDACWQLKGAAKIKKEKMTKDQQNRILPVSSTNGHLNDEEKRGNTSSTTPNKAAFRGSNGMSRGITSWNVKLVKKYVVMEELLSNLGYPRVNQDSPGVTLLEYSVAKEILLQSPCLQSTALRYLKNRKTLVRYKR